MNTYTYKGNSHPFYHYGESYTLHIHKTIFKRIHIYTAHGYDHMPIRASITKYKNRKAFTADWQPDTGNTINRGHGSPRER
jgi:hypothetical protein